MKCEKNACERRSSMSITDGWDHTDKIVTKGYQQKDGTAEGVAARTSMAKDDKSGGRRRDING